MENENKNYIHLNDILHIPNQNNENKSSYFQDLLKKVLSTSSAVKKVIDIIEVDEISRRSSLFIVTK
jgi:hypothetical protein